MMPPVESTPMTVVTDYNHQVHLEEGYSSIAAYPAEVHDASLYYHNHHPHHHQQQHVMPDPSSMMDSSYNLTCDYNNTAGYCQTEVHQANYPYQHYAAAAVPVAGAPPCDAQSSGYYGSPSDHHHQQHHYTTHQPMTDNSSSVSPLVTTPYDCYSNSHDHLELKYQAAFVDALESHNNTSMETSTVEGSVVATSNNTSNTTNDMVDPLQINSNLVQQMPTPEFQYEYETNYSNNEWTMTTSGHYTANTYPTATVEAYPTDNSLTGCTSDSDISVLPNYCFAACVFTTPPASSETVSSGSAKVMVGTYSPTTRHFESYDSSHYQSLNEEPLHPAL